VKQAEHLSESDARCVRVTTSDEDTYVVKLNGKFRWKDHIGGVRVGRKKPGSENEEFLIRCVPRVPYSRGQREGIRNGVLRG